MTRLQRRILLSALLASLAAVGLRLAALQTTGRPDRQIHAPDFYIEQPGWQLFDKNGRLQRELRADRLEQWPGEAKARLTAPQLRLTDRQHRVWRAGAELGWIPDDQHSIVLEKQVRLQREPANSGPVVTTEQLRITAKGDRVETDRPVVLTSGNWHFSATGLRAELGRQQLELFGNVRGIHD